MGVKEENAKQGIVDASRKASNAPAHAFAMEIVRQTQTTVKVLVYLTSLSKIRSLQNHTSSELLILLSILRHSVFVLASGPTVLSFGIKMCPT